MLSHWPRASRSATPYSRLAGIYDFVMRHVPYDEWAAYLVCLFDHCAVDVKGVLDIACGTGSLMVELQRRGYSVAGFDASPQMVTAARQKLLQSKVNARVWVGAIEQFRSRRLYDAILCTYDSMNYCRDISACRSVMESAVRALCPGGLFIFDVTTRRNSKRYFQNHYDREKTTEFEVIRQSHYDTSSNIQTNEFLIMWPGETTCFRENHRQHIFALEELRSAIPASHYELLGLYDSFSLALGTETSERVTFVLKKRGGVDG